ncbi:hypothetical protein MKY04_18105 [Lysinibacillus telephonicus]|uniref:hypothetical protein n=1 Tax=Lysinibacillus telephonicus TaxID=1714840 RepID=UPI0031FC8EEE
MERLGVDLIYMSEELEEELFKKFPWFVTNDGEIVFCNVGVGWYYLLVGMLTEIEEHFKLMNKSIDRLSFSEIKEKHGLLRVYTNNSISGLQQILRKYEFLSEHVCEICGNKGELRDRSWSVVLCDRCLLNGY